jgi:predicted methyltransferase
VHKGILEQQEYYIENLAFMISELKKRFNAVETRESMAFYIAIKNE